MDILTNFNNFMVMTINAVENTVENLNAVF